MRQPGIDGFENSLVTLLERSLGKVAASAADVSFDSRAGRDLCRVDARAADQPVYVEWKGNQLFFVRMGNPAASSGSPTPSTTSAGDSARDTR